MALTWDVLDPKMRLATVVAARTARPFPPVITAALMGVGFIDAMVCSTRDPKTFVPRRPVADVLSAVRSDTPVSKRDRAGLVDG